MKVKDILSSNTFELITDKSGLNNKIIGIFASDLLSHVMGNASESNILITVLSNINVLGVASLLDLSCVIFSHNIKVNDEIVNKANELNIPLLKTKLPTVETILILSKMGI
ncbi:MAG: DRTGG domain protein [Candidatus Izimaplasma bacterium HR2]|nr:MAG: DRTGG domain protein [Candidatus Izimaplasma bacterium HR2]